MQPTQPQNPKKSKEKIETLPGIDWNAKAVIGNAMEVVEMDMPCMVVWMDKDGEVRFRACGTNERRLWMCEVMKAKILGLI